MKLKIVLLIVVLLGAFLSTAFADQTQYRTVKRVQLNSSLMYFVAEEGGWGAPGCPDATYVYINQTNTAAKYFYSAALASNATKAKMSFLGSCTDANYFLATYMFYGE